MIRAGIVVVVIVAAGVQTPVPPVPPTPPAPVWVPQQSIRDPGGTPQKGTGVIVGTVLTADVSAQPVRRATVTVTGSGLRNRQVVTDSNGRFVIPDLPAGNFTVSASKPSYISATHGARPGQPGAPIALAAGGQAVAEIRMPKGAVIAGTIFDQFGRPRPQVRLDVFQYRTSGGRRQLTQIGSSWAVTDDRGNYRAYGLPAGDFIIAARAQGAPDVRMVTAEELRWAHASMPVAQPGTAAAPPPPPPAPGPTIGLAPVYYPGVVDVSGATAITLNHGDERTGLDFQLQSVPTAKIEGVVLGPDGQPAQPLQVRIWSEDRVRSPGAPPPLLDSQFSGPRINANTGGFTFTGVAPGRYVLSAQSTMRTPQAQPGPAPVPPQATTLWAFAQVDVNGRDVSNLGLTLQPGLSVSGRVVFSGTTPPTDLSRVRVNMSPADPLPISVNIAGATPGSDGSFTLRGAVPGRYRLTGSAPPTPGTQGSTPPVSWALRSAIVNGRDVLDGGLDVQGSDVPGLVLTFTDKPSEISGRLLDAAGAPAKDLWVMCFATDPSYWTAQSRRTRVIRPNPDDGRYRFNQWVPGEYFLVAVVDGDQIDLTDQATLNQIAGAALRVTLAEGEKLVQNLKVAR
jgi:hypothetical protein